MVFYIICDFPSWFSPLFVILVMVFPIIRHIASWCSPLFVISVMIFAIIRDLLSWFSLLFVIFHHSFRHYSWSSVMVSPIIRHISSWFSPLYVIFRHGFRHYSWYDGSLHYYILKSMRQNQLIYKGAVFALVISMCIISVYNPSLLLVREQWSAPHARSGCEQSVYLMPRIVIKYLIEHCDDWCSWCCRCLCLLEATGQMWSLIGQLSVLYDRL